MRPWKKISNDGGCGDSAQPANPGVALSSRLIGIGVLVALLFATVFWLGSGRIIVFDEGRRRTHDKLIGETTARSLDSPAIWDRLKEKLRVSQEKLEAQRSTNWIANFPYKKLTHPTLRFDPSIYDPANSDTWHGLMRRKYQPVIKMHGYLMNFFENERRFSKGFEQLYHILSQHDRHDNPRMIGSIFQALCRYHRAARHPSDEIITKKEFTGEIDPETGKHVFLMVPQTFFGSRGEILPPRTWGEEARVYAEGIVYKLHARKHWPEKEWMPEAEAMALRDRIIDEIDPADIPSGKAFAFSNRHELALQPGDSFLIPNEGWVEALWKYQDEVVAPLMQRRAEEAIRQRRESFQVDGLPTFHPSGGQ